MGSNNQDEAQQPLCEHQKAARKALLETFDTDKWYEDMKSIIAHCTKCHPTEE